MRIGIVRFLNARPLDYAIRRLSLAGSTIHLASSESPQRIEIIEEDPSRLCDLLLQGKLDCALISSVECLRNPTQIGWCQTVGICTHKRSHSILYIRRNPTTISQRDFPSSFPTSFPTSFPKEASVSKMYYDRASRSSVALWKCLYLQSHENLPESEEIPSSEIPRLVRQEGVGGILIGDPALQFLEDLKSTKREGEKWIVTDLGEWWYEKEGLPFVFALWAYPLNRPIHDSSQSLYLAALKASKKNSEKNQKKPKKNLISPISSSFSIQTDSYWTIQTKREGFLPQTASNRQEINEEDQAHLSEFDLGILYILWSQSQTLVLLL